MAKATSGAPPQRIEQWSYSRWTDYNKCPRYAKYKHVLRMKTPGSPAMERGLAIHKAAEDYLAKKRKDIDPALKLFKEPIKDLRACGAIPEGKMAFTINWEPTGWFDKDCWVRVMVDVTLFQAPLYVVIDWKTGKKYGDHPQQLKLYGLAGLLIEPKAKEVLAQDWYVDQTTDNVLEEKLKRSEVPAIKKDWEKKTKAMLNDTIFAPLPSYLCRYCHFSRANGGPCEY